MLVTIIQVLLMFGVPLLILKFKNCKVIKLFGTIAITYFAGIIFSLILYGLRLLGVEKAAANYTVGSTGSFIIVAIAIPLILFSSSINEIGKLSKKAILSWTSLVISVIITTTAVYYVFGKNIEFGRELTAMASGLYTGGTPNLNALGVTFNLAPQVIAYANLADTIFGGVFYMFLLSACKPLLSKIMKTSKKEEAYLKKNSNIQNYEEQKLDIRNLKQYKNLVWTLLLSIGCCVVSAGLGMVVNLLTDNLLIDGPFLIPFLMGGATLAGCILSFNKKVANVKGNYALGQYFILVFSFAISSVLDFELINMSFIWILVLFGVITTLILIVHVIISKIFKLDVDLTMVTLTAGVYGPAFVPAITNQIKNDNLTAPGLICGSFGYAMGTFLGMLLYLIFR